MNLFPLIQVDLSRIIAVYIVELSMIFVGSFLIFKLLKRKRNRLTYFLVCYFSCLMITIILNAIYAVIFVPDLRLVLYEIAVFFLGFSQIFTMFFTIEIYWKKNLKIRHATILMVGYGSILILLFTYPGNIALSAENNWNAIWNPFILVAFIIGSLCFCYIPTIVLSLLIYRKFEHDLTRKKWRYFIVGISGVYAITYATLISYSTNNALIIYIYALFSLSLFLWGYLIYYGVAKAI